MEFKSQSYSSALKGFLCRLVENSDPSTWDSPRIKHISSLALLLDSVTDASPPENRLRAVGEVYEKVDTRFFSSEEIAWLNINKPPYLPPEKKKQQLPGVPIFMEVEPTRSSLF